MWVQFSPTAVLEYARLTFINKIWTRASDCGSLYGLGRPGRYVEQSRGPRLAMFEQHALPRRGGSALPRVFTACWECRHRSFSNVLHMAMLRYSGRTSF